MKYFDSIREKYSNVSIPIKASLFYTICSVLQKIISLVTMPIFTRVMTTEEYGEYTLFITWQSVMLVFTSLSLHNAIFNKAMVKYSDDKDGVVSAFYGLIITITVCALIVSVIGMDIVCSLSRLSSNIIILLFIDLLFAPMMSIWMARERFEYKYKHVVIASILLALMNPLLGLASIIVFDDKAFGRILSVVLVDVGIGIVLFVLALRKNKRLYDREYWGFALKNNIPMIPHYLSGMLLNHADRIMISHMCNISYAAIYGVAYSAAMTIQIVVSAINASLTPWLYRSLQSETLKPIKKINNELIIVVAIFVGIFMLFGPEAMYILGGKEYLEAKNVFPYIACSVFFIFLYCRLADVEFFYGKSKYILTASVMSLCINVFLNWLLIPIYGYVAAGVTTLISYVVDSFIHCVFIYHILGKDKAKVIYDFKLIFLLSFSMIALSIIVMWLYNYAVIRYVVIFICLMLACIFRKRIVQLVKQLKKQ